MKTSICLVTSTRADWGIVRPLAKKLNGEPQFELAVAATGTHLSKDFGNTYKEIGSDGFVIDEKIDLGITSKTSSSEIMANAILKFSKYFEKRRFDLCLVLGDRFEIMAVCCAAVHAKIPIAHISGGDTTQGANDEYFRHCISKMSYLHFTTCEEYRRRVIQLGEHPGRVFNTGSLAVENIMSLPLLTKEEICAEVGIGNAPYAVVTFHPVTLEHGTAKEQIAQLLQAAERKNELHYIFTKANADLGGFVINAAIEDFVSSRENCVLVESLGSLRYLSALKHAEMVIGNSSSGILEAPALRIPTVNIGDRQKGRIQAESIINCEPTADEIVKAMDIAGRSEFRGKCLTAENPYGNGEASGKIVEALMKYAGKLNIQKEFYDITAIKKA